MKELIISEIELVYKSNVKPSERLKISSSQDAEEIFRKYWDINKIELVEQFKVMLLSRSNGVLGIVEVSQGGIASTVADPKIILGAAIKAAASAIILAHNHPSGSILPSCSDIELTRKIKLAAGYLDITILDHLVLTSESYTSFADQGHI